MATTQVRKYAAICFTDIVGFSKMAGANEALALELLDEHQEIVRACIQAFEGREVKTIGDAFMVEFAEPAPAVEWAVEVQRRLDERNATVPPERVLQIRMGIHAGDVVQRGSDLFGDGVNIAARVEPQAPAGGVAISGAVHDAVAGKVPLAFEVMEARALKNIEKQIALYRVILPWVDGGRTAAALAEATLSLFGGAAPVAPPAPRIEPREASQSRVALLPLANASGEPADAFIPAAIHADLLGVLAGVPDLQILGRDSVARFAGPVPPDHAAIAAGLRAGLILTGAAGISAGQLRVSLACIETTAGETLWQEEFTVALASAAEVYAAVVARVAETVGVEVPDASRPRTLRRLPASPLGVIAYLRGLQQLELGSIESLQGAQDQFKAALRHDPRHALSQVGLAECFIGIGLPGRTPPAQRKTYLIPGASDAGLQALELDRFLPEAHAARGRTLAVYTFDFNGAEQHLRRALRGGRGATATHLWLALTLAATGRIPEADEQVRLALDQDPKSAAARCVAALLAYLAGDHAAAAAGAVAAHALDPGAWVAWLLEGWARTALGETSAAEEALRRSLERSDRHPIAVAALGYAFAASGRPGEATRLRRELEDTGLARNVPAVALAILEANTGMIDQAIAHLEQSLDEQNWLAILWQTPVFAPLRGDPRFQDLLLNAGLVADAGPAAAPVLPPPPPLAGVTPPLL